MKSKSSSGGERPFKTAFQTQTKRPRSSVRLSWSRLINTMKNDTFIVIRALILLPVIIREGKIIQRENSVERNIMSSPHLLSIQNYCSLPQVVLPFSLLPFSWCPSFSLFILQRHLEAYRNMHRLRDALHQRYAALLKDKVNSQRLLLQQRNETARAKSENETKQVNVKTEKRRALFEPCACFAEVII